MFASNWDEGSASNRDGALVVERKVLGPALADEPASNRVSKCPLSNLGDPKLEDAPSPLGDDAAEKRGEDVLIDSIEGGRPDDESIRPRPEGESRVEESVLIGCWGFNIPDDWERKLECECCPPSPICDDELCPRCDELCPRCDELCPKSF